MSIFYSSVFYPFSGRFLFVFYRFFYRFFIVFSLFFTVFVFVKTNICRNRAV